MKTRIPVIFDGAMGTQILLRGVTKQDFSGHDGCNEILNTSRPDVIIDIHKAYLFAGANAIETNTFGANRIKLAEYGLGNNVRELNVQAALVARKAIEEAACPQPCFVCGSMGPTGVLLSSLSHRGTYDFKGISEAFEEQAHALATGGVDILLLETSQDLLEVRAAIIGVNAALRSLNVDIPLQVQITVDANGRMLLGSDIAAFLGAVSSLECDCIGFNCSTGPDEMRQWTEQLLDNSDMPVAMLPNAGMPKNIDGKAVYAMDPVAFADVLGPLVWEKGLAVVGGCCGTGPDHIRQLSKTLANKKVAAKPSRKTMFLSTGISGLDLEKVPRPIIIGERLNTQGSKKTKELVLEKNWDEMKQVACDQIEKGSHVLDICVAVSERDDESESMASLVSFLSERVSIPLCIDSTELSVFQAALIANPGSMLINSINLEHSGEKARTILPYAKQFGCPVIALTIDDEGMAKTVDKKLEIADRIVDLACGEFGLPQHFIYIDPLTFTLATGDNESADAAKRSLEALFRIKEQIPGVRTVMGVSNVSYGLKPASRRILNNCMLHHAVKAGLDAAIFNPMHLDNVDTYDPAMRALAEDLLFNRNAEALTKYIAAFDDSNQVVSSKSGNAGSVTLSPAQMLHDNVVNRDKRNLKATIETLLKEMKPQAVLNEILLPAMAMVGDKMNKGEMILPFVLQAAEVMKEAITVLEPYLAGQNSAMRGKIVLATVYGDVHDIGKNLVASILKNQGYDIVDCGKQIPMETIVRIVKQEKPDAVGLSALLVATSKEMGRLVAEFDKQNIDVPILIGGAAVNTEFAARIEKINEEHSYKPGVFFAKDAFEAIKVLDSLKARLHRKQSNTAENPKGPAIQDTQEIASPVETVDLITPQFYGTSQVLRWETSALLDSIDTNRLFKGYFGGGKLDEKAFAENVDKEFMPVFNLLKQEILSENLIDAAGLYGIFPVFTHDTKLVVLDAIDYHTELAEFEMPRVERKHNRSITDYFRGEGDVVGIQIVTIGKAIGNTCESYFTKHDKYSMGFYLNAIANYLTEQLANKATAEIKRVLFIQGDRGRRYSFGYPGLPGVEDHTKIFDLLGVEERLGMTLTSGFQMIPEHSTAGIFVHHPHAEYM